MTNQRIYDIDASTISGFNEAVDDRVAALLIAAGVLIKTYDDAANTLTLTATSGGSPIWHGAIYGAYNDCNPHELLKSLQIVGAVSATPANIGTAAARVAYFKTPAAITINRIRFYGVGINTAGSYHVAIYNADTLVRLTADLTVPATVASAFQSIDLTGAPLALAAGQLYFIAVSATTAGTVAGIGCFSPNVSATTGAVSVLPKNRPGNLNVDLPYVSSGFAQFAVVTGILPAAAAALTAQPAWTGGFPAFWLDNNSAA